MKPTVTIAIPALDEEQVIRESALTVREFADRELGEYAVTIVIADNGSMDGTGRIGQELAATVPGIAYLRVAKRGKGNAVASAWSAHPADICAFMDADLSTDLAALLALLRRVHEGAGLAVGSRFHDGSVVKRSWFRRALSSGYRRLMCLALGLKTADAPCGFKAVSAGVVRDVMPQVRNHAWFFDSELVVRAERAGHEVVEIPVQWHEKRQAGRVSKVRIGRLVMEYVREILRLRRELGPAASDPGDRFERRVALTATIAFMALTSLVPLYAMRVADASGLVWNGRTSFAPGDLAVYLSSISQAASGRFFLMNLAGAEGAVGVPHPIWQLGGLLVRITGIAPLGAYHVLRLLFIPLLAAALLFALRQFVESRQARIVAFLLLLFGSGIGLYASYAVTATVPRTGAYEWPVDLWVAEANVLASSMHSPHFIASWALLVLAAGLLSRAFERRSLREAVFAGVAALGLASFHPFYALTIGAVATVWLGLWFRRRGFNRPDFGVWATFCALLLPALAYYGWLVLGTPNGTFMSSTNLLWTPSWQHLAAGFAGFLLLAPIGYAITRRQGTRQTQRAGELALWAIVTLALAYAPISFQRRLLEGLQFPLAALTSVAVVTVFGRLVAPRDRLTPYKSALGGVLLVAVFLPSSFAVVYRDLAQVTAREPMSFFQADEAAMYAWLRSETPRDAIVLSTTETGNGVLGWGERATYAGHWAQTVELTRKAAEISWFYDDMPFDERRAFVVAHGIVYIVEGPRERAYGGTLAVDPGFQVAFERGAYMVYEVSR